MKPLQQIMDSAVRLDRRIVLSEGEDPRVVAAAVQARNSRSPASCWWAMATRSPPRFTRRAPGGLEGIEVHDPASSAHLAEMADTYHALRKHKGVTPQDAAKAVQTPMSMPALLVRLGHADGTLAGP